MSYTSLCNNLITHIPIIQFIASRNITEASLRSQLCLRLICPFVNRSAKVIHVSIYFTECKQNRDATHGISDIGETNSSVNHYVPHINVHGESWYANLAVIYLSI
jgi:hypothetical protein